MRLQCLTPRMDMGFVSLESMSSGIDDDDDEDTNLPTEPVQIIQKVY